MFLLIVHRSLVPTFDIRTWFVLGFVPVAGGALVVAGINGGDAAKSPDHVSVRVLKVVVAL